MKMGVKYWQTQIKKRGFRLSLQEVEVKGGVRIRAVITARKRSAGLGHPRITFGKLFWDKELAAQHSLEFLEFMHAKIDEGEVF
jgi:hypothetical protein